MTYIPARNNQKTSILDLWRQGQIPQDVLNQAGVPDFQTWAQKQTWSAGQPVPLQPYQPQGSQPPPLEGLQRLGYGQTPEQKQYITEQEQAETAKRQKQSQDLLAAVKNLPNAAQKHVRTWEEIPQQLEEQPTWLKALQTSVPLVNLFANPIVQKTVGDITRGQANITSAAIGGRPLTESLEEWSAREPEVTYPWKINPFTGKPATISKADIALNLTPDWLIGMGAPMKFVKGAEFAGAVERALTKGESAATIVERLIANKVSKAEAEKLVSSAAKRIEQASVKEAGVSPKAWTGGDVGVQQGMMGAKEKIVRAKPAAQVRQGALDDILKQQAWNDSVQLSTAELDGLEKLGYTAGDVAKMKPTEGRGILKDKIVNLVDAEDITYLERELYNASGEAEALQSKITMIEDKLKNDPVANWRGGAINITNKKGTKYQRSTSLLSLIGKAGDFPDAVTTRQARALLGKWPSKVNINPKTGKVPWVYVMDNVAEELTNKGVPLKTDSDLVTYIKQMWNEKQQLGKLRTSYSNASDYADELAAKLKALRGSEEGIEQVSAPGVGHAGIPSQRPPITTPPATEIPGAERIGAGETPKLGAAISGQQVLPPPFEGAPIKSARKGAFAGAKPIEGAPVLLDIEDPKVAGRLQSLENFNGKHPYMSGGYGTADRAAISYLESADTHEAADMLNTYKDLSAKQAAKLNVAVIKLDKEGKRVKPLISRYGNAIPAKAKIGGFGGSPSREVDIITEFKKNVDDIGYVKGNTQPVDELFHQMDKGEHAGIMHKYIKQPGDMAELARAQKMAAWVGDYYKLLEKYKVPKQAMKNGDMPKLIDLITSDMAREVETVGPRKIMGNVKVQQIINKYPQKEGVDMVRFARRIRELFDNSLFEANLFREARGQELVKHRTGYFPLITKKSWQGKLFGLGDSASAVMADAAPPPDFIKRGKFFNPRELPRNLTRDEADKLGVKLENDVTKLMRTYFNEMAKDMFYTNVIDNGRLWARFMRQQGLKNSARLVDDWIGEVFAGAASPRLIGRIVPQNWMRGPFWLKRQFNSAVFSWNLAWTMLTQPSAQAASVGRLGFKNTMAGFDYIFSKEVREVVARTNVMRLKNLGEGLAQYEGLLDFTPTFSATKGFTEKADYIAGFMTRKVEEILTGCVVSAALKRGRQIGLTGRELLQYAGEQGARVQGIYNYSQVAGVLRNRELSLAVPFQTFAFEMATMIRSMSNIKAIRAGAYKTIAVSSVEGQHLLRNRIVAISEFIAAMFAINAITEKVAGRQPWQLSTFIPFFSTFTMGVDMDNTFNAPFPVRYINELYNGVEDIVKYGNWKRFRKWVLSYHIKGGVQGERLVEALEALANEGEVKDVRGKPMYKVEGPMEWLKTFTTGITTTEAAQKKFEVFNTGKGALYEQTGIPLPNIRNIGKELNESGALLGKVNPESKEKKDFTTSDYGAKARDLSSNTGNRFAGAATPLGRKAVDDWAAMQEYYDQPVSERLAYRSRNPDIDAMLFFWERVTTLQTQTATDLVSEWIREYHIPDEALPAWAKVEGRTSSTPYQPNFGRTQQSSQPQGTQRGLKK